MNKKLAVIVVNHNNQDDVVRIYSELKKQTFKNYFLIVVDDNSESTDKLKELTSNTDFMLTHFSAPFRVGYANKHNRAFVEAINHGADYIYKMHTDMTIVSDDLFENMLSVADSNSEVACVGPTIFNGQGQKTWGPGIVKKRCGFDIDVQESYLVRSSYLTDYNGFQDEVFDWFGEEMDFLIRVKNSGNLVKQVDACIVHFGGASSSSFRLLKCRFRADSSLVFLYKHNRSNGFLTICNMYAKEMRSELIYLIELIRNFELLMALKGIFLIAQGFLIGVSKILLKKYNKMPQYK